MAVSAAARPTTTRPTQSRPRFAWSTPRVALSALVFTRLPVLIVGMLAVSLVGTDPPPVAEALWRVKQQELPNLLARWDTYYYQSIAVTGYAWDPNIFRHDNVVFFPLYPLLMRWGGAMIGGHPLLAGLAVSLTAFTAAIALLHQLAVAEMGPDLAQRVVLLFVTFPFALFFSTVYTESLFLLLTVGAFCAMRRGRLTLTALCGLAVGLTRPNGFWLSLPLAILAWTRNPSGDGERAGGRQRSASRPPALRSSASRCTRPTFMSGSTTHLRGCMGSARGAFRCSVARARRIRHRFPGRFTTASKRSSPGSATSSRSEWRRGRFDPSHADSAQPTRSGSASTSSRRSRRTCSCRSVVHVGVVSGLLLGCRQDFAPAGRPGCRRVRGSAGAFGLLVLPVEAGRLRVQPTASSYTRLIRGTMAPQSKRRAMARACER